MKKVTINGREYQVESGARLRPLLEEFGMLFPCQGKGQCGKCRIICPEMEITDKDRRYLSDNAIFDGVRIACDKIVKGDYVIECSPPTHPKKVRELSSCNVVASITAKEIKIGIADDVIASEISVVNPLWQGDGLTGICARYEIDADKSTKTLRSVLAKESIELFELYGMAKAETFVIATNGIFANILVGKDIDEKPDYNEIDDKHNFDLPCESVYFVPTVDAYVGGDILSESVALPENTLLLDCEEIFSAIYIGKDDNISACMWDLEYDEIGIKAVRALTKIIRVDGYTPFVVLLGEYAEKVENGILSEGLEYTTREKKLSNVAKVLTGLRHRAKLRKEKERTSCINVLKSEDFHRYFAEL